MKRWTILLALLLSLGVNLGLVAAHWIDARRPDVATPPTPSGAPGPSRPAPEPEPEPATAPTAPTAPTRSHAADPRDLEASRGDPLAPAVERRLTRIVDRMATRLRLEGDARRRFSELQMRFFRRSIEARRDARRLERALREEIFSPRPDRARAEELLDALGARQIELEAAFIDTYFDTLAMLGPRQQQAYREILGHLRDLRRAVERRSVRDRGELPAARPIR